MSVFEMINKNFVFIIILSFLNILIL